MAQRVAGVCFVKVDGAQLAARGSWEWSPFTSKKEGVAGQDQVHGFKEMPTVPYIKGKITDLGGVSVSKFQNFKNSTVTLETASGKVIVLRDAWVKDEIVVNSEDGSYDAHFEGMSINEQTA